MTSRISPNSVLNQTTRVCEKSFQWYSKGYVELSQDFERSQSALEQRHPPQPLPPQTFELASAVDVDSLIGEDASVGNHPPCPTCFDADGLALDFEIDVRWM